MSRLPAITAVLALLLLARAPLAGQGAAVAGVVRDAETEQPVAGAAVTLPDLNRRVVTDSAGRFALRGVPAGEQRWVIRRVGYAEWAESAAVEDGDVLTIRIIPRPLRLEVVRVTADRLERRRRAYGGSVRVVDTRELETTAAHSLMDVVRYRALSAASTCRAGALCVRGAPIRLVIDEQPALSIDETVGILQAYHPSEIHAVEALDGGSEVRIYTKWFMQTTRGPLRPLGRF